MKVISWIWLIAVLCWACGQESIRLTKTEAQFKRLVADAQSKFWELQDNGEEGFEPCTDGFVYIFTKNDTDTSTYYITQPLLDCDGNVQLGRDTLSTRSWSLSDTESSLFDDMIFLLEDNGQREAFRVLQINPEVFEIRSEEDDRRLRFVPVGE